jgi:hypothetical protein
LRWAAPRSVSKACQSLYNQQNPERITVGVSDKHRGLLAGIERADTITLCPHKQLYTPQGMSLCFFKDPESAHASSVQAAYQSRPGSFDMGQYTLEGSRPAICLCSHAMLCVVSKRGIGALVDQGIEKTRRLAEVIATHPAFQLIGSPEINILNYRYLPRGLRHKGHYSLEESRQISAGVTKIQAQQFLQGKTFVAAAEILSELHCSQKITVFRVVIANPLTRTCSIIWRTSWISPRRTWRLKQSTAAATARTAANGLAPALEIGLLLSIDTARVVLFQEGTAGFPQATDITRVTVMAVTARIASRFRFVGT